MVFIIVGCLFAKFSACFFENTYEFSENPSSNPLQEACFDFPVAVCADQPYILS